MSELSRPDFSKGILDLSERFQHAVGHTRLGSKTIRAFTGSSSPSYHQHDWYSANVTSEVKGVVQAHGEPESSRLARNWKTALLMMCDLEEIKEYKQKPEAKDAIAYISEDVVHVGVRLDSEPTFLQVSPDKLVVAMRIGRAPLQAMMGVYIPNERHFIGADSTELFTRIPVDDLPTPGIVLV